MTWRATRSFGLLFSFLILVIVGSRSFAIPDKLTNPTFDGLDLKRKHLDVVLSKVIAGVSNPTDIQFVPGKPDLVIVLEKAGKARWFDIEQGKQGVWFTQQVLTKVEEGLLGLAFHPQFQKNGKFYIDYVVSDNGNDTTHIAEWSIEPGSDVTSSAPKENKVLIRQEQPFQNHKSGQLVFGADGMLYAGFGDGGSAGDPHKNGQNKKVLLGKILRIDVDHTDQGKNYAIPSDNPFARNSQVLPEIFASGFRNPWRFAFDDNNRLIVGDVGQDLFEEVDIVQKGQDYGWNIFEGRHCFKSNEACETERRLHQFPVVEYGHEEGDPDNGGSAIIGGVVARDQSLADLKGKYLFADFGSGKIWAAQLPDVATDELGSTDYFSLGRWPITPSTFGRDSQGRVYISDLASGLIYRIEAP